MRIFAATIIAVTASLLVARLVRANDPVDEKLDDGLTDAKTKYPVFVRMEDQLFRQARDYPAFCKTRAGQDRRELRTEVVALLRKKSHPVLPLSAEMEQQLDSLPGQEFSSRPMTFDVLLAATPASFLEDGVEAGDAFLHRPAVGGEDLATRVESRRQNRQVCVPRSFLGAPGPAYPAGTLALCMWDEQ